MARLPLAGETAPARGSHLQRVSTSVAALRNHCGWLEYIADGPNAAFFEPALVDLPNLLVPSIIIYEVCKRVLVQRGQTFADRAVNAMSRGQIVHLDADNLRLAAVAAMRYRLAMADAIIWRTACLHKAQLLTQDAHFEGKPGVRFIAKASP